LYLTINKIIILINEQIHKYLIESIKILPQLLVAILVFILFFYLARYFERLARRMTFNIAINKAAANVVQKIVYLLIVFIGIFISLSILNLDKTLTSLLAGAGVIGLALGFAFQEIASNFVSGIFIAFKHPYKISDFVSVQKYQGTVSDISLRTTSLMTVDGLEILVPNKIMFTEPLTNYNTTPKRRIILELGVSYNDNLNIVETLIKEALEPIEEKLVDEEIEVFFKKFADSAINFEVRFWIHYPGKNNYMKARHKAIIAIKETLDKNNINIPFPIRTLEIVNNSEYKLDNK
jgi:small conductance mechanosensitive channel